MSSLGDFKTFFKKVESIAKKLFGSTTWEQTVQSVITYAAPLVETLVSLVAGSAAGTLVAGVVAQVKSDLATISATVQGSTVASGSGDEQTVVAALGSIKANLSGLLTDADVKNEAKFADIETTSNLIINETDAILENIPSATAKAAWLAVASTFVTE